MKKIFFLISVLTLSLSSCNDQIEILQVGELNDARTFTSIANIQQFLNEVYDRVTVRSDIAASSILTDEVSIGNLGSNTDDYRFFILTTNGNADNIWLNHLTAINYANRLLDGAALYTPTAAERPAYNSILAQARAIRAFCHFQMCVFYSPNIADDNALGGFYLDFVPSVEQKIQRATNGRIFGLINSDLDYAQANLIEQSTNRWRFINFNFIKAFRARMALYRGDMALAKQFSQDLISNSGVSLSTSNLVPANFPSTFTQPALTDPAYAALGAFEGVNSLGAVTTAGIAAVTNRYKRMWLDAEQGEVLFALDRPLGKENIAGIYSTNSSNIGGATLYDMGRNLFNLLEETPGDIRRWTNIDRTSRISPLYATVADYKGSDVPVIDKYPGIVGAGLINNLKVFRLSEMYFILAETRVAENNFAGAAALIKNIRDARNYINTNQPLPVYNSAQQAYADILKERRKELCFEGHRYIDLKRLGARANVSIDRYSRDCDAFNVIVCGFPVTDYRFTLPIPQREMNGNPVVQNPGY